MTGNHILLNFRDKHPFLYRQVVCWERVEEQPLRLRIKLNDGHEIIYDDVTGNIITPRHCRKYDKTYSLSVGEWRTEFSKRLIDQMEYRMVDQAALAAKTGMSEASISRYVSGLMIPRADVITELAKALNCTPNHLIDFYE